MAQGPSQAAWEAALRFREYEGIIRDSLDEAYPVIRADVIAEVVTALREWADGQNGPTIWALNDFIEREFGGPDA